MIARLLVFFLYMVNWSLLSHCVHTGRIRCFDCSVLVWSHSQLAISVTLCQKDVVVVLMGS
jgi:uncharacterized membrane protein